MDRAHRRCPKRYQVGYYCDHLNLADGTCEEAARTVTDEGSQTAALTINRLIDFAKIEPLPKIKIDGGLP